MEEEFVRTIDVDNVFKRAAQYSVDKWFSGSPDLVDRNIVNGVAFTLEISYDKAYKMIKEQVDVLLDKHNCCGGGCHVK